MMFQFREDNISSRAMVIRAPKPILILLYSVSAPLGGGGSFCAGKPCVPVGAGRCCKDKGLSFTTFTSPEPTPLTPVT
eukprot:8484745-Heterocapsa_arctica.AAC.1